jgi:RsiW-degrading membrane proteinase PrsW (M82 family)
VTPLAAVVRVACLAAPGAAGWLLSRRAGRPFGAAAACVALGLISFIPAYFLEVFLRKWAGLDEAAHGADIVPVIYALLVAAPLEQGLKFAAFAPVFRTRKDPTPLDGVIYAGAAALGFATAHNALYLFWQLPEGFGATVRAMTDVPAQCFFAAVWGYALGKDPERRLGGRGFNVAWLVATLFNGVFDNIAFARRLSALIAVVPILLAIGFITFLAARDLLLDDRPPASRPSLARRFLPAIAPPTMQAMRAALRRSERPIMVRWIGIGALVTTGVMTVALIIAVAFGHQIGLDFAAVDRGDTSAAGTAPLVLLGAAALSAFPIGGYLVSRAAGARSVLEPAIGAALAIAGVLVLLGLAAPVAVVFAVAFAPVAFGLACAGAWMGMTR